MKDTSGSSYHKNSNNPKYNKKDASRKPSGAGKKTFKKQSDSGENNDPEKRSFRERPSKSFGEKKPFSDRKFKGREEKPERKFRKDEPSGKKPFEKKPFTKRGEREEPEGKNSRSFEKTDRKEWKGKERRENGERSFSKRGERDGFKPEFRKPGEKPRFKTGPEQGKKSEYKPFRDSEEQEGKERKIYPAVDEKAIESAMTLNKYIAYSGACSRRDAAEMVKKGKVRVNGELILEPGYRVVPGDQVTLSGKKLTPQKGLVYILLNKPKGYITTTEDPEDRKTVMDLVANAEVERLFPVGRLDRNTTGVLLLTNDGPLAHKLAHPSYNIKKVYQVTLDKNLTRADYEKIAKGLTLEDGFIQVDAIAYLENRHELGIEIHSGKNRIVRRIFESLGYTVEKLDRVMYAGLTKKNVSRGKWRFLDEKEVILLKHFKQ